MNKRGISGVVTTLIFILLAIVAIGIVWAVISNLLNQSSLEIQAGVDQTTLDLVKDSVKLTTENSAPAFSFKIKNTGQETISKIKITLFDGENTQNSEIETNELEQLEERTYTIKLNENLNAPTLITVTPIILVNGQEVESKKSSTFQPTAEEKIKIVENSIKARDPESNLIAWYKFEDNANDNEDNFEGTLVGSVDYSEGKSGKALDLNGNGNDRIDIDLLSIKDKISANGTIIAWAYPEQEGYNRYIIHSILNGKTYIQHHDGAGAGGSNYNNALRITKGSPEKEIIASQPTPLNEWQHLASSWSNKKFNGYYNGERINRAPISYNYNPSTQEYTLRIGSSPTSNTEFIGKIDEVMIFDTQLSDQEISMIYSMYA